ncbi:unnamed protein product [Camellia sinensis]
MDKKAGGPPPLPLPPPPPPPLPIVPPNVKPEKLDPHKRSIISRHGFGSTGRQISLLTNHFKVSVRHPDKIFYQYTVSISSEDKRAVESKGFGRKVVDKLYKTYSSELAGKGFAYDGEKSLYTVGPLPQNNFEFTVVLEESFAKRGSPHGGSLKLSYAAKIPLKSISLVLQGSEPENIQDTLRVLDIILRQQAANRGCLLVRQSFFHDDSRNFTAIGGGVTGCRGFHSSFLPIYPYVSTTMILTPGPVIDFLLANQNARDPRNIDWAKAKRMLKNMRVKTRHRNMEFKITGLSEKPCNQQFFPLKVNNGDGEHDGGQTLEITVYDYFTKHHNMELTNSEYMPCIDVGKPERPIFRWSTLVSLQRHTKALSSMQRAPLVEKSSAVRNYHYDDDPLLVACGISIERQLTQVDGRVLEAPRLKVGNSVDCVPRNGRWNFNNKNGGLLSTSQLVVIQVIFPKSLLTVEGTRALYHIERPHTLIEEDPQYTTSSPLVRVEKMFKLITAKLPRPPEFLLCVLPERKNYDIYGPWKKKSLSDFGIATQCISPTKINDQYLTNVLLKINTKLRGTNSLLAIEHSSRIPLIKDTPTMILGMDVSHESPGRSDIPSIAAVVGSCSWPLISRYRAALRTQSSKVEMIESLYKPLANGKDDGIMRELLVEFYKTSNGRKPGQIIVFSLSTKKVGRRLPTCFQSTPSRHCWDGVSESQFNQVLNNELDQIIKAYQHLGEVGIPMFTVIVAQKNHHTKLFQASAPENVPPGTVVDTKVVHPRNYDFYMCAQAGMIGTSRPAHYHVLLVEIGFSPDDLQNFIHSLSYVYQRSTAAISIGSVAVPELPRLHRMFRVLCSFAELMIIAGHTYWLYK